MMDYGEWRYKSTILDMDIIGGGVVIFTPRALEKGPQYRSERERERVRE
jgi:hypothetical protein